MPRAVRKERKNKKKIKEKREKKASGLSSAHDPKRSAVDNAVWGMQGRWGDGKWVSRTRREEIDYVKYNTRWG